MAEQRTGRAPELTLREIAPAAFLPPSLFAVGQGAIAPVVVITATDLGASPAIAAVVVAVAGVGQIIADIPAGALVQRFGERTTMLGAAVLTVLALLGCVLAPTLAVFMAAIFLTGAGTAVWLLARQAYVTEFVPFRLRATAMSTLGGVYRIGLFVGAFAGGAVILVTGPWGRLRGAHRRDHRGGDRADAGQGSRWGLPDPAGSRTGTRPRRHGAPWPAVAARHPRRRGAGDQRDAAARQVVLPLWGQHLGLSPAAISVIFGLSGAVDMLLFYPAGRVMDRFGRVWVAVPSMVVLGVSLALVPLTQSALTLTVVGLLMGIGNGMGSGLVMTLGADLAPPDQRPVFLGSGGYSPTSAAAWGPSSSPVSPRSRRSASASRRWARWVWSGRGCSVPGCREPRRISRTRWAGWDRGDGRSSGRVAAR